jgi:hypothetical protein
MEKKEKAAPLATGTASNTAFNSRQSITHQDPVKGWYALADNARKLQQKKQITPKRRTHYFTRAASLVLDRVTVRNDLFDEQIKLQVEEDMRRRYQYGQWDTSDLKDLRYCLPVGREE